MARAQAAGQRLAPTALVVAGLLAIGSLLPVLRDSLVAARLGASDASDAYFLSTYLLLMVVMILVADSLTPAAVVMLATPDEAARHSGWSLRRAFGVACVALALVAALMALLAGPLVGLVAPGFDPATTASAVDATRVVAPGVVFLGLAWLLTAYLNASGYFVIPAMMTPIVAVGAIIPLLAGTSSPVVAAAGWTLGAGLAFLVMLGASVTVALAGRSREPTVARIDRHAAAQLARTASPFLALVLITQSAEIADRLIPSGIETGALTTVALAKKIMILPNTILVTAVGAITLPFISRADQPGQRARAFAQTIDLALFFLLPAAALLALTREDVIQALFGRGEFGLEDVNQTTQLLGVYALALVPLTLGVVLQRSFATLGRSWAPLIPYSLAMTGYISGALIGSHLIGLVALPIAFGLAELAYLTALLILLNRQPGFQLAESIWPAMIALLGAAVAAGVILAVDLLQIPNIWLSLALKGALAAGAYFCVVIWLRHPSAGDLVHFLGRQPDRDRSPRPRVAVETTYAHNRDGTGRYISSLVRELHCRNELEVVPFSAPRIERAPRWLRVWLNGSLHIVWLQAVLPFWAWRRRIGLIHTSMIGPVLAPCPVVITVHDALDYHPGWRTSALWSAYVRLVGSLAVRRATRVISGSRAAADDVERFFQVEADRLRVVPYGSNLDAERQHPPAYAAELGGRFILVFGSTQRHKNLDTAVSAVGLLRDEGLDVSLVIVGRRVDGSRYDKSWIWVVNDCPDDELTWLYTRATVVCVPSRYEGFGLPVVEALALGTPVVASDIPALREVGGEAGRYAAPDYPEAFAEALRAVLADPEAERLRIGQGSKSAQSFTWVRTADGIVQVYFEVLEETEQEAAWVAAAPPSP